MAEERGERVAIVSSETVARAIVKLIAADLLPMVMDNMVLGNIAHRWFEPTPAKEGDSTSVRIPPLMVHRAVGGEKNAAAQRDCAVGELRYVEANFQIPDITKVLAVPDLLGIYAAWAAVALAEQVDRMIFDACRKLSRRTPASLYYVEGKLDGVETALFNGYVPETVQKFAIVSDMAYGIVKRSKCVEEFKNAGAAGLHSRVTGPVSRFKGIWVVASHSIPEDEFGIGMADWAVTFSTMRLPIPEKEVPAVGRDYRVVSEYAELVDFGMRVVVPFDMNSLSQNVNVAMLGCAAIARDSWGVKIGTRGEYCGSFFG